MSHHLTGVGEGWVYDLWLRLGIRLSNPCIKFIAQCIEDVWVAIYIYMYIYTFFANSKRKYLLRQEINYTRQF